MAPRNAIRLSPLSIALLRFAHTSASAINEFCVVDTERPVDFNPLADVASERRTLAESGMVLAFKRNGGNRLIVSD